MLRPLKQLGSTSLLTLGLVSCGDGGFFGGCGRENELFQIWFGSNPYTTFTGTLKKGSPYEIKATVSPESCRGEMNFSVTGTLPPGMKLDQGNVVGTPSTTGSYTFQVAIVSVDGYKTLSGTPKSNGVILNVTN
jgi:hypothetical protein